MQTDTPVAPRALEQEAQTYQENKGQGQPYVSICDRYAIIKRLGNSSEGLVDVARALSNGQLRVMKIVKHLNRNKLPREARMLGAVGQHENLVRLFETEWHPSGYAIMCLEYCSKGDMHDLQRYLQITRTPTPAKVALQALINITEGLAFIHGGWVRNGITGSYRVATNHTNIVHRDLKPANLYIRPGPVFVIGDFGQAFDPTLGDNRRGGTNGFRAPEFYFLDQPPLTRKADIYSFAITLLSLCQGLDTELWPCGAPSADLRLPRHLANFGIQALLRQCLEFYPKDRPDMSPSGALWYVPGFRHQLEGLKDDIVLPHDVLSTGVEFAKKA